MQILVVTQYFWPEHFRINDLVLGLKERGHAVTVLTGKPNYPSGKFYDGYSFFGVSSENWNGIKIYRSPLIPRGNGNSLMLGLNYLTFAFFSMFTSLKIKEIPDIIFVYEPSPITVGIPAVIAKWKFKVPIYFWVQDLWPDSIASATNLRNPIVLGILDKLTKWIYSKSDMILIQSRGFEKRLLTQGVSLSKIIYYPNWTENYYKPIEKNLFFSQYFTGKINLVFAGNIGESQDFETLIDAAAIVYKQNPDLNWVIIGDGRMKSFFGEQVHERGLEKVFKFIGSFPPETMPAFFTHADALLVSLKKDPLFAITIPSKIQSYMACGKPLITSLDGEGNTIVEEAKAGFTSEAGNPESLARVINEFVILSQDQKSIMGMNALNYYKEKFDRDMLIDKLIDLIKVSNNG
jgi:glycosyltransferase involved in cell wall biosynthesis